MSCERPTAGWLTARPPGSRTPLSATCLAYHRPPSVPPRPAGAANDGAAHLTMSKRLAVFDFDCTLVAAETIDRLGEAHGVGDEIATLTQRAMSGELDFFSALNARVELLAGMPVAQAEAVCASLPITPGAEQVVTQLRAAGYTVVVMSGGFDLATAQFRARIGYDLEFANQLHQRHGRLTGRVGGAMMFQSSKGDLLRKLQELLGVDAQQTLVCGDGANDLSLFQHASTRIAFGHKGVLDAQATHIVPGPELTPVLSAVGL